LPVFKCNKDKKTLRRDGKNGTLKYIQWGEAQFTKERGTYKKGGISYTEVPSVAGRKYWYDIGEREPGDFLANQFINERFFFPSNDKHMVDHTVFEGLVKSSDKKHLTLALLNSTFTFIEMEISGRVNLGEGLLTLYGPEISELRIFDVNKITNQNSDKIITCFEKLRTRPIKPIFDEVKMKDRQSLDRAVLEAVGLDPKRYLKPLYEGLTGMVRERLELAKSRKKLKNAKSERNHDKLKDRIIEEFLPDGPKKFPEDFISKSHLENAEEISVPGEALKMGAYFMGRQEVISDDDFKYDADSRDTAKFIIYAQKVNSYIMKIPRKRPAIIKAVDEYERYVKDLKTKFIGEFNRRILDHKKAEILTAQVLTELNIPEIP
jgi:hypothetical protein